MSSTNGTIPEWVKVGANVKMVHLPTFGTPVIRDVTIEKVGKRDVVVTGGRRFNGSKPAAVYGKPDAPLYLRASGDAYRGPILLSPQDPRLADWVSDAAKAQLENDAHSAYEFWRRDRTAANASGVVAAFAILAEEVSQ